MKQNLECVIINPANKKHNAVVIWLHGLGADGYDFADIVKQFNFPDNLQIKFIFPHAPIRPITINSGYKMRGWYDIYSLDSIDIDEDLIGIEESSQQIIKLIQAEEKNIEDNKIMLAGFSQGGTIALHTGLNYDKPLAGILALSTYLSNADNLDKYINVKNKNIPIMLLHGSYDNIIPISVAKKTHEILLKNNCNVTWNEYPMQHNVCAQEIKDISVWMTNIFMAKYK